MLDSTFSVHEIRVFGTAIAQKTRAISALSLQIAIPLQLRQNLPILIADLDLIEQVRPVLQRLLQCHPAPPSPDRLMIPTRERFRNRHSHKLRRTRVVRIIHQPSRPLAGLPLRRQTISAPLLPLPLTLRRNLRALPGVENRLPLRPHPPPPPKGWAVPRSLAVGRKAARVLRGDSAQPRRASAF